MPLQLLEATSLLDTWVHFNLTRTLLQLMNNVVIDLKTCQMLKYICFIYFNLWLNISHVIVTNLLCYHFLEFLFFDFVEMDS